ncbi:MAG: hypothetical protein IJU60_05300 [Acholeplasmatales bacterium]|nr:hypothetical protein [Acholeplasmatales bacterium]
MFYSIVSLILGAFLLIFGSFCITKKNKISFIIITYIVALGYIGVGIWSFFLLNKDYEFIPVLTMLGITIIYVVVFLFYDRGMKGKK